MWYWVMCKSTLVNRSRRISLNEFLCGCRAHTFTICIVPACVWVQSLQRLRELDKMRPSLHLLQRCWHVGKVRQFLIPKYQTRSSAWDDKKNVNQWTTCPNSSRPPTTELIHLLVILESFWYNQFEPDRGQFEWSSSASEIDPVWTSKLYTL